MLVFILHRLVQAVIVMLTVAFMLFQYVGDLVTNLLWQDAIPEQRIQLRKDLGLSLKLGRKVSFLIAERLPATLGLAISAGFLALLFAMPMGVYAALRRGSFESHVLMAFSLPGVSLPTFLIGILLISVFAADLRWLPAFGRGEVVDTGHWATGLLTVGGWRHLILPSITLVMHLVRAEMLEVLRADYIKFARARARALPNRIVYFSHALKNTMVPVLMITGLQLGSLIAFAIITEQVFQWPGMGLLFIQAVQFADIPVIGAPLSRS